MSGRGIFAGVLLLIALEAALAGSAARAGSLLALPAAVVSRLLDPTVPAIGWHTTAATAATAAFQTGAGTGSTSSPTTPATSVNAPTVIPAHAPVYSV